MSALTPKELADFRWKAKQQYPNFGSRQIKKLFAHLDEQIARAEQAEHERGWLAKELAHTALNLQEDGARTKNESQYVIDSRLTTPEYWLEAAAEAVKGDA